MEQKLVRVPFNIEQAKKITNKEIKGKIVTRNGKNVRIVCWDYKSSSGEYPLLVLVENGIFEEQILYTLNGRLKSWEKYEQSTDNLMLEIPEYLTFKNGDIIACGWEGEHESSNWISIVKSVKDSTCGVYTNDYVTLVVKSNNHSDGLLIYDDVTTSGEWIRKATEEETQKLIDALKESKEPQAKKYLKRFFWIEDKPKCEFDPFDKVLVRDDGTVWKCDLFSHEADNGTFICVGHAWKYCIPYNKQTAHLLGTY